MSHTSISSYEMQLFEIESKTVDELLKKAQEEITSPKPLRKPPWLQWKLEQSSASETAPITHATKVENNSHHSRRPSHQQTKKSTLSSQNLDSVVDQLCLTAVSMNYGEAHARLTRESFTAEDPISVCIDTLHYNLCLKSGEPKPQLVRPKGLPPVNLNSADNCSGMAPAYRGDTVHPGSNTSVASTDKQTISSFEKNPESTTRTGTRRNRNRMSPNSNVNGCHNLRRQKSSAMAKLRSDPLTPEKTQSSITAMTGSEASTSDSQVLAKGKASPGVKTDLSVKRTSRKRPGECSRGQRDHVSVSDEKEKDDAAVNDTPSSVKRRKLSHDHNAAAVNDTPSSVKRRKLSHDHNAAAVNDTPSSVKRRKLSHDHNEDVQAEHTQWRRTRNCMKQSAVRQTPDLNGQLRKRSKLSPPNTQKSRRKQRRVISKNYHLLCISCKHGFLSTSCLLCSTSSETVNGTKSVSHKSISGKSKSKHRTPCGHKKSSKIKTESVTNGKKHSAFRLKSSPKQNRLRKHNLSKKVEKQSNSEVKEKSSKKRQQHQQRKESLTKVQKQSHLDSKKKVSRKQGEQTIEKTKRKQGESSQTKVPKPSRSEDKHFSKKQSRSKTDPAEADIVEHHMQLASQKSFPNSSVTFSSTKDVFSQLCHLEERSKEYDNETLQAIMPVREIEGKSLFAKPVSVYSSTPKNSHIGGIWKSIFSER